MTSYPDTLLSVLDAFSRYAGFGYERPVTKWVLRIFGVYMRTWRKPRVLAEPCEFLVLSPSLSWHARVGEFVAALKNEWPQTVHAVVPNLRGMIKHGLWAKPSPGIPLKWSLISGYANFVLDKYSPKVIVTFSETDLVSFFLYFEGKKRGVTLVNIAHSVLTVSHLKAMFCFDYYFIYGPSSAVNARVHQVRFGTTRLVQTGSITLREQDYLEPNYNRQNILFFSTFLYGGKTEYARAFDKAARHAMATIAAWAARTPTYRLFVKLHPEEDGLFTRAVFSGIPNVTILPVSTSIREALEPVSLSLGMMTNAAIESARMNRPYLDVFPADFAPNYLHIQDFFGPRLQTSDELDSAIRRVFECYPVKLAKCRNFVDYHLSNRSNSAGYAIECLGKIRRGSEPIDCEFIAAHLDGLGQNARTRNA